MNDIEIIKRELALEKQLFQLDAKESLLHFTRYTMEGYKTNFHHKSYAATLDKFIAGDIKRLMVFMPPQHGKSELCSRRMPAKVLGDHPDKRVAVIAYNHTFASKFNRDVQRIIDSPEYKELYPDTTLSGKNVRSVATGSWLRNSDEFEIVGHKGSLISVGIGGGLTGNKVDMAIVDDPYKDAAMANSEAFRRKLVEWWEMVLETRLNNVAQICLTFTRWRADDIAGYLLDIQEAGVTTDDWTVVRYQAIKEEENDDPLDTREIGEALWPEEHSAEKINNMAAKNPTAHEALNQQNPVPKSGNVIKDHWFINFEHSDIPPSTCHMYVDTAQSEEELKGNDPSGILIYRKHKNDIYLVYFFKGWWGITELCKQIKWAADKFLNGASSEIAIENKSNGASAKKLLSEGTGLSIVLDTPTGKKQERVENEEPIFEAGRVHAPKSDHWFNDFEKQCLGFPLVTHDEEVDCLTGAIRRAFHKKAPIRIHGRPAHLR